MRVIRVLQQMTIYNFLSFLAVIIPIVYSPGPMTMFLMANGMQNKFTETWPVLFGANNAYLLSIIIFSMGLDSILRQNVWILNSVQIIGIMYLLYLAYVQWGKKSVINSNQNSFEVLTSKSSLYYKGAFVALTNPKAILLFSLVLPQFANEEGNFYLQICVLGMTFLILQFSSGCIYLFFGRWMSLFIEKPHHQALINRVSSLILILISGFLLYRLIYF